MKSSFKGELILEQNCLAVTSPKKRTKHTQDSILTAFRSFFGRSYGLTILFEFNWLLIKDFLHFWKFPTALLQKVCRPAWGTNHLHTKNCRIYRSNPNLGATKLQLFCNNKQLYVLPWGKIIFPTKYIFKTKFDFLDIHTIAYLLTQSQWSWKPIWSHIWFIIHLWKNNLARIYHVVCQWLSCRRSTEN